MTKKEILKFVEKNPVFSLATIDGAKPRVRMMMVAMVNENGLVFTTGRDKAVCKQMTANPAIEMCFYSADEGRQDEDRCDFERINVFGEEQFAESARLEATIRENLAWLWRSDGS